MIRLILSKKNPLQTDFLTTENKVLYTSETIHHTPALHGSKAMTTVTRRDHVGDLFQVGVIEWPANPDERPRVYVRTRYVEMTRTGLYTAPEKFQAHNGRMYEWQIENYQTQLVPLQTGHSAAYVAAFLQTSRGSLFSRKQSASLFVPPEGIEILDDIVVTFIYFESQWRERERFRSRTWDHPGPVI
ncbi:hypothetical protein ID866_8001 [Astraeus odoratus]|nr:hypothetical protein ID866_8001 [Astraeus odoratus]